MLSVSDLAMALTVQNGAFLLLIAVVVAMLTQKLNLPYSAGLVAAGIALAFSRFSPAIALTKDLLFTVLLPPLIFQAAFYIEWRRLRRDLGSHRRPGNLGRDSFRRHHHRRDALPGKLAVGRRARFWSSDRGHRPGIGNRDISGSRRAGPPAAAGGSRKPVQRRHGRGGIRDGARSGSGPRSNPAPGHGSTAANGRRRSAVRRGGGGSRSAIGRKYAGSLGGTGAHHGRRLRFVPVGGAISKCRECWPHSAPG